MQGRGTFRFHSGHDGKPWGRRAEVDEALSNGHLCPFLLATTSCMGSKGTGGRPLRRLRLLLELEQLGLWRWPSEQVTAELGWDQEAWQTADGGRACITQACAA